MMTLIAMLTGIFVGVLLRRNKYIIRLAGYGVTALVWILLFFTGISAGANKIIAQNIKTVGMHALLLGLSATMGSVMVSSLLYNIVFKKQR